MSATTTTATTNGPIAGACGNTCDSPETDSSSSNNDSNSNSSAVNANTTTTTTTESTTVTVTVTATTTATPGVNRNDPANVLSDELFLKIFDYLPEYYLSIGSLVS